MPIADLAGRILALAVTLHDWLEMLAALEPMRRERVAKYAEAVADTLDRAGEALLVLEVRPGDRAARRLAVRELGRIAGYVETIVTVLQHHLDGRKLAGIKRRLERIAEIAEGLSRPAGAACKSRVGAGLARIDRLAAAEGYFRALADGLRA